MSEASAAPVQQPGVVDPNVAPAEPTPTPAAEPAVPAALNVSPPEPPPIPAVDENVEVLYNPTGDATLDLALAFVGKLGYGPDRPEIQAAQKGDFSKLEAALKVNPKATGYDKYVAAAKESYARSIETRKSKDDAAQKAVVEAVGGVEKWNAIHAWVVAEADNDQKAAINAAFQQGGFAATAMANQLAQLYTQSGVSTQKPKSAVKDTAANAGSDPAPVLDRKAYSAEIAKLQTKYGYRLTDTQEYAALSARYLASTRN